MGKFWDALTWPFNKPSTPPAPKGPFFPPEESIRPSFKPLVSNSERAALFGKFDYVPAPISGNPERIHILGDWQQKNIVWVPIPQLVGIPGVEGNRGPGMYFHRLCANQLTMLWKEWESAGLLHYVKTFEGSFAPRFVRGSQSSLSNHCFGNAFDINYAWNTLGAMPAGWNAKGTVRPLVPLADKWGFFWGGFYSSRKDGMHFEVGKIIP